MTLKRFEEHEDLRKTRNNIVEKTKKNEKYSWEKGVRNECYCQKNSYRGTRKDDQIIEGKDSFGSLEFGAKS